MLISILSKLLGFGREMVQSYVFGASAITDAYLVSGTIPSQIFGFISAGIATGFIPMYSRILKDQGRSGANRYVNNLVNVLLLLATATVVIVILLTEPLVKLFAGGFRGETLELAVNFTRIAVFGVYCSAVSSIFVGYLRLHRKYVLPTLAGLASNLILIPAFYLSAKINIYILAGGSLLASALPLVLLIPAIRGAGFKYQLISDFKDKEIKTMIRLALPVALSRSVSRINVLVDRTLASAIAVGGISALNYADRIGGFIQGLFVDSITAVLYPNISKMAAEGDIKGLKKTISEAIGIINLITIPATAAAMIFSREIVALLFGRGAFSPEAQKMTAASLFYYSLGTIPKGLRSAASRSFYARQDMKTPALNATVGVVINIALNIILSKFMGLGGLALATSISALITAVLMFVTLRQKIGPFGLKEISKSFLKISGASALMGWAAWCSFSFLGRHHSRNLSLIGAGSVGAMIYALLIYFLKIPEVENTLDVLKTKWENRKIEAGD